MGSEGVRVWRGLERGGKVFFVCCAWFCGGVGWWSGFELGFRRWRNRENILDISSVECSSRYPVLKSLLLTPPIIAGWTRTRFTRKYSGDLDLRAI